MDPLRVMDGYVDDSPPLLWRETLRLQRVVVGRDLVGGDDEVRDCPTCALGLGLPQHRPSGQRHSESCTGSWRPDSAAQIGR